ncbi:transposase-like protein [Fusarium oxysporum f. sp. phaseoli]
MANSLLADREALPVGKLWVHNFIQRQPELKACRFRRYDYKRAKCEDPTIIQGWFRLVENTIAKYGIQLADIWNFDETGFMMGMIEPGMVVTSSERRGIPKKIQPGNREWITVIQAVNAEGQSIAPFIIGSGQYHLANWYRECNLPGDWVIALSENGWTNNQLGLDWLQHFDRSTKDRSVGSYRLFILDGHESHHSIEFERYCEENKIITLCMPAHASHLLQPLDVGCFGPLKKAYGREIERLMGCSINHITKIEFFPAFHAAHRATITESNIKGGFRGAGLAPFDPENVISKLDVQLRTPTPPAEVTIPSTPWTARTPKTLLEAQSHSKYLQGRVRNHKSSSPESIIEAVKHFEKATSVLIHKIVLLEDRLQQVEQENRIVKRRRRGKRTRLQKGGPLTIEEASQAIDQMDVDTQVAAESSRSGGRGRISPSVMCGAAADATRRVGQNSSQYKRHLLQQIIFAIPCNPKRPRLDQSIIPKAKVKAVQELSVGFVIDSDVPFTIFEHKFLKELFYQFDHELALQIPWSSSSITRELQKIFESKADIIKAELGSALTKIHISFDLWTSPNRLAIMAVFAHFIDKFGNQQSRLLALRRQLGIHSGENLAETLFEIVQLWDIRGQVGTVISDNVTTNDTCLSYFYRQLDPSIRPADIKARRMRCYGHVLNLVARAFLFGKDAESFELESDINGMRGLQEQDLRHWRSKGPIGKLHNIVKFIRSSPQRSEYFKRIAHEHEDEGYHLCEESTAELEAILNNETRWNSTYMMIERALRKQTDIRAYIFALEGEKDEEKRIPADDILSNEDWRVLDEVNEILTPLYHQTMRTQGWGKGDSHGRLWEVLVGMEYLLEHFEDWKGFYNEFTTETIRATNLNDPELIGRASAPLRGTNIRPARSRRRPARFDGEEVYVSQQRSQAPTFTVAALPEHSQAEYAAFDKPPASKISQKSSLPADHRAYIRASINNGWKKLDEYYSKLGESPLFAAAVILHPRFGISWLEATWATEEQLAWVRDAKAGIKDYFARWYQSNQRTDDLQSKSASSLTNRGKEDDHYTQWINSRTKKAFATSSSVSEMDKYLRLEPQDTQEPIQWWRDHKPSFPVLSSFALDVFAIPAMATDCERQFSLAKLTLTSQRLAMGADTLERVHCLRNWVRHGGVKLGSWVGN